MTMAHGFRLKVKILDKNGKLPEYKTAMASGMDLYSAQTAIILPHEIRIIKTGIAIEVPKGYEGQIRPRSGLAVKGITVMNSPGTIDADYRGEVMVILINHSNVIFDIGIGDRIAQLVIAKVCQMKPIGVSELSESARGTGGFGSTGK